MVKITNKNNDIKVLDFFAGSGTALHSVMKMNESDNGSRQCIIVTNNENNICEEVTYPRCERLINKYVNKKGLEMPYFPNNNLRYYTSEFVSRETSLKNKRDITRLATELLCIREDVYNELQQIDHYSLVDKFARCFKQGQLYILVIYDEELIEELVEVIEGVVAAENQAKPHFKVYVFSNGQYPYTEELEEVLPHVTLCALPDALYKAYQNALPKRKRPEVPELEESTAEEVETSLQSAIESDLFNQA